MSDFKSKLPDFKELTSMTSKLYKGIKSSVQEIIQDYKQKRAATETKSEETKTKEEPKAAKPAEKAKAAPVKAKVKPATTLEENKEGTDNREQ